METAVSSFCCERAHTLVRLMLLENLTLKRWGHVSLSATDIKLLRVNADWGIAPRELTVLRCCRWTTLSQVWAPVMSEAQRNPTEFSQMTSKLRSGSAGQTGVTATHRQLRSGWSVCTVGPSLACVLQPSLMVEGNRAFVCGSQMFTWTQELGQWHVNPPRLDFCIDQSNNSDPVRRPPANLLLFWFLKFCFLKPREGVLVEWTFPLLCSWWRPNFVCATFALLVSRLVLPSPVTSLTQTLNFTGDPSC